MRVVIQRVKEAKVSIGDRVKSSIGKGILILLGIEREDNEEDIAWLSGKISRLRIFDDKNGIMNLDVKDIMGDVLLVSQFTLHASTKKGNRPSYIRAASAETGLQLYKKFIEQLESDLGKKLKTGEFGAMMDVYLVNDGPVTIIIDSKSRE